MGGKWVELLKEAAPHLERVAFLYNPEVTPNSSSRSSTADAARIMGISLSEVPFRNPVELVRGIDEFAVAPNGGLPISYNLGSSTCTLTCHNMAHNADGSVMPATASGKPR